MIVLDVCLGLTKTKVCKVLDQNVCHVFAPDRSSLQKSKASLLLEERVPLFHWDYGPAWGWWWIRWRWGRTGPCLPSSRQSQHSPGVESSKSESGEKKNSPPVQALTDLIVVLVQEWTQQPRRFRHLGGDQVQEESWWEEEVQGLPGQKDLPSFFNAPWQGRCSQSWRQGPISKR